MRGVVGFVVCLGFLVACSDSSSNPTDPGPDPNGEDPIDLAGTWSYEAAELTGNGARCTIDDATMELTQDGDDFSGTATGRLSCDVEGQDWEWEDRPADVDDGSLDGSDLTFVFSDLNSQAQRAEVTHEGTIDGDAMSGTATLNYENFELTGEWTATRE